MHSKSYKPIGENIGLKSSLTFYPNQGFILTFHQMILYSTTEQPFVDKEQYVIHLQDTI